MGIDYCYGCGVDIDFCTCDYHSISTSKILKKETKRIKGTWTDYTDKILHDLSGGAINIQNTFDLIEQLMAQGFTGHELFKQIHR